MQTPKIFIRRDFFYFFIKVRGAVSPQNAPHNNKILYRVEYYSDGLSPPPPTLRREHTWSVVGVPYTRFQTTVTTVDCAGRQKFRIIVIVIITIIIVVIVARGDAKCVIQQWVNIESCGGSVGRRRRVVSSGYPRCIYFVLYKYTAHTLYE